MEKLKPTLVRKKSWIPRSSDRRSVLLLRLIYASAAVRTARSFTGWRPTKRKENDGWALVRHFSNLVSRAPGYLVARQSSNMPNAAHRGIITEAFSSSGSDSSESSSSSLTSSRKNSATTATTVVQQRRNSEGPRTLQSLVRTKCWSIAPLWKFVTYELETAPIKPQLPPSSKSQQYEKLSRSASFRPKKQHQKQVKTYSFLCL